MSALDNRDAAEAQAPEQSSLAVRLVLFGVLSLPILAGFFVPGFVWLSIWWVAPLAAALGPRIWPGTSRGTDAALSLGVAFLAWAPTSENTIDLVLPLCGTDAVGVLVPAAVATVGYAVFGVLAVAKRQIKVWFAASVTFAVVHGVATYWVMSSGMAAPVSC